MQPRAIKTFVGLFDRTMAVWFECFPEYFVVSFGQYEGSCPGNDFLPRQLTHQADQIESSLEGAVLEDSFKRLFRALKFLHSRI